jgi:hypothetical protein
LFKPVTPLIFFEPLFSLADHNANPNPLLFALLGVEETAGELEAVKL